MLFFSDITFVCRRTSDIFYTLMIANNEKWERNNILLDVFSFVTNLNFILFDLSKEIPLCNLIYFPYYSMFDFAKWFYK